MSIHRAPKSLLHLLYSFTLKTSAIYNPRLNNNEEESAALWKVFCKEASISGSLEEKVFDWIIATKSHKVGQDADNDLKLFLDFDLAVLGKPQDDYNVYADNIRKEYIHYSDDSYRKGRISVLQKLMKGDLFFTDTFINLFDKISRDNMSSEITKLQKSIAGGQ
mmetsp:Transcript_94/g.101  ORF Transcript_94/g.101 Transcript_94/m.101 type:complete len:164 (+) Transcript_94:251-742(+)